MKAAVEECIAASREKMRPGRLEVADLDQLEALLAEPRQLGLHLNSRFPISKLYSCQGMDNDYLGFEFILEKWV